MSNIFEILYYLNMQRNNSANEKLKSRSKDHSKSTGFKSLSRNKTEKNLIPHNDHKIKIGLPLSPKSKLKKTTLNSCKSKDKLKFHISLDSNKPVNNLQAHSLKSPKFQQKIVKVKNLSFYHVMQILFSRE